MKKFSYTTVDITFANGESGSKQFDIVTDGTYQKITGLALYKSALNGITHVNVGLDEVQGNTIQKPTHMADWMSGENLGHHERYKPYNLEAKGKKYVLTVVVPVGQVVGAGGVIMQLVFRQESEEKSC